MSLSASQGYAYIRRAIERLESAGVDFNLTGDIDEVVLGTVRNAVDESEWTDRTAAERLARSYLAELVAVGSIIRNAEVEPDVVDGLREIIRRIINGIFDP